MHLISWIFIAVIVVAFAGAIYLKKKYPDWEEEFYLGSLAVMIIAVVAAAVTI